MKILAFTDIHGDLFALEDAKNNAKEVDLAVCLGDISFFEHDIEFLMEALQEFPVPVLLLHGNHEQKETVELLASQHSNIIFLHEKKYEKKGFTFLAYGGDGFSKSDSKFVKWVKKDSKGLDPNKTILLLHGPPYNTNLDIPLEGTHCGNISTHKFIKDFQPLLALVGHIHECEEQDDWIGKSYILNPGPYGIIIDLNQLHKFREDI